MIARTTAVIFDLFGTLVPPVDDRMYRASAAEVAAAIDVDPAKVATLWMHDAPFHKSLMTSGSSTQAQIDLTCQRLGISRSPDARRRAAAAHLDAHRIWLNPWPTSVETLQRLQADGLRVGLISDCSISVPELWSDTVFDQLVDCAVFSVSKVLPSLHLSCTTESATGWASTQTVASM
jgi:putative hydrolase of the HAD superfamily